MADLYHFYNDTEDWYFTNAKRNVTYSGQQYEAQPLKRERWKKAFSDQEVSIELPSNLAPVNTMIVAPHVGNLWVTISDTSGDTLFFGKANNVEYNTKNHRAKIAFLAVSEVLEADLPNRRYSPMCNWNLYDDMCKVSSLLWRVAVNKAGVTVGVKELTATVLGDEADGWWTGGYVERGTERQLIVGHSGTTIQLLSNFVSAQDDTYYFYPGCDKQYTTCQTKFSNSPRFGGFRFVPRKNPVLDTL